VRFFYAATRRQLTSRFTEQASSSNSKGAFTAEDTEITELKQWVSSVISVISALKVLLNLGFYHAAFARCMQRAA